MSYQHIVIATDFSEPAQRALEVGKRLAQHHGARVSLANAYDVFPMPSAVTYPAAMWTGAEIEKQLREDARRSLEELAQRQLSDLPAVEIHLLHQPSPALAICDHAAEQGADLIVVGTHGRTGMAHLLIGSVSEVVVRHAPCPVLVVRAGVEPSSFPQHIVACTDFSPAAEPALEQAAAMMRAYGARVTLLHVYVNPPELPGLPKDAYRSLESIDADLRVALTALERKHFGGAVTTALLVAPNPADAIATYAQRHGADLVCVATHGRTGIRRLVMGSVAEKVVRHAPCAVLVARSALEASG